MHQATATSEIVVKNGNNTVAEPVLEVKEEGAKPAEELIDPEKKDIKEDEKPTDPIP